MKMRMRIDTIRELGGDRRKNNREHTAPCHHESGPRGGVTHVVLQPLRRQYIDAEEGAEGEAEHQHAGGEAAMPEDAQVDNWELLRQLPDQEGEESDRGNDGEHADFRR